MRLSLEEVFLSLTTEDMSTLGGESAAPPAQEVEEPAHE